MKIYKLDEEEKNILKNIKDYEPVKNKKILKSYEKIAKSYSQNSNNLDNSKKLKNIHISIRINKNDLDIIKQKAIEEGLPYQTLIGSVLHKFANK